MSKYEPYYSQCLIEPRNLTLLDILLDNQAIDWFYVTIEDRYEVMMNETEKNIHQELINISVNFTFIALIDDILHFALELEADNAPELMLEFSINFKSN